VIGVKPTRPSLRCQAHLQFAQAPLNPKTAKEPSSPFSAPTPFLSMRIAARK